MSSSQVDSMPAQDIKHCANCQSSPEKLKQCAKCHGVWYCHKRCQGEDFNSHKKDCTRLAGLRASKAPPATAIPSGTGAPAHPSSHPDFALINNRTFLHNRPEKEVYKLLVDTLRMREADIRAFGIMSMSDSMTSGSESSIGAFTDMLRRAERLNGFLPPWWSKEKEKECIELSEEALGVPQDKTDIQRTWNDEFMPMKLRGLFQPLSPLAGMMGF